MKSLRILTKLDVTQSELEKKSVHWWTLELTKKKPKNVSEKEIPRIERERESVKDFKK